jgi:hypothetical protein
MHWCPSQQQTLPRIPQRRQGTTGLCYGQEIRRQGFSAQKVRRSRIDFDWRQCRMPELRLGNAQLCYESGTTRTHIPPLGVNRSSTSTTRRRLPSAGAKSQRPVTRHSVHVRITLQDIRATKTRCKRQNYSTRARVHARNQLPKRSGHPLLQNLNQNSDLSDDPSR